MSVEAWVTIGIAVASGFGIWMFRVDRGITRMQSLIEELHETKARVGHHDERLADHDRRITRLEPRRRSP